MDDPHFTSRIEDLGDGRAILRLEGEIDLATRSLLDDAMGAVAKGGFTAVVIDGTEVSFMDSTGFHAFLDGKRLIHEDGIRIILVSSPSMRQVLELLAPDPIFAARVDSMDEAMALLDG